MTHYTEVSKSIEALSNVSENGSGALETFLAKALTNVAPHLHERAAVHGVQWGEIRTRLTSLSPKVRTA
jgi:hypothetical protein